MITKQELKAKYGDDIVFLFKGEEPFTSVNNAPGGMLIERKGKVLCYECNKWFKKIGPHLIKHNMTIRQYKEKYGFNYKAGLCCKKLSRKISKKMSETMKNNTNWFSGLNTENRSVGAKSRRKTGNSMQRKNHFNTCPEQIKKRMMLVVAKFGDNPDCRQAIKVDKGIISLMHKHFGTWNKAKEFYGLKITSPSAHKKIKNDADLIYDMREYVEKNGRLPFKSGEKKDVFNHSWGAYLKRWGSALKIYLACGIEKRRRNEWVVIN